MTQVCMVGSGTVLKLGPGFFRVYPRELLVGLELSPLAEPGAGSLFE